MSPCNVRHAYFPRRWSMLWDSTEPVSVDVCCTDLFQSVICRCRLKDCRLFCLSLSTLVYRSVAMGSYSSALVPGKPYDCCHVCRNLEWNTGMLERCMLEEVAAYCCGKSPTFSVELVLCCNACSLFVFVVFKETEEFDSIVSVAEKLNEQVAQSQTCRLWEVFTLNDGYLELNIRRLQLGLRECVPSGLFMSRLSLR